MQQTDVRQVWLAWAEGRISDDDAQAAAESVQAKKLARPRGDRPLAKPLPASRCGRMRACDREKVFDAGRCIPLDRNAKARIVTLARALMHRTEKGKAYGIVTAKMLAVLQTLLWGFHNAASGKCFPSYESIADHAGCARSTVYEAITGLERAGILTWVNRIKRVREYVPGLFGKGSAWRWRVVRTSNAYAFSDPASKSDSWTGTTIQDLDLSTFLYANAKSTAESSQASFAPEIFGTRAAAQAP